MGFQEKWAEMSSREIINQRQMMGSRVPWRLKDRGSNELNAFLHIRDTKTDIKGFHLLTAKCRFLGLMKNESRRYTEYRSRSQ